MSRQEDFIEAGIQYRFEHGTPNAIGGGALSEMVREANRNRVYEDGCEHGYQYAVEKVLKELFMIELSNFFPELDEVNTTAGQQRLIEFFKQVMEE